MLQNLVSWPEPPKKMYMQIFYTIEEYYRSFVCVSLSILDADFSRTVDKNALRNTVAHKQKMNIIHTVHIFL